MHGQGEYKTNEITYIGGFSNGFFHGEGTLIDRLGNKFDGNFVYGLLDGEGTIRYANGLRYKGGIRNWKKNGYGTFTNDAIYEGNFKDD